MKYTILISLLFLFSCQTKDDKPAQSPESARAELIAIDKQFSQESEQKGMKTAFIETLDSNAVLLRPGTMPIKGADALDHYLMMDDSEYTMNWQPQYADVAASGDIGYTYGVYAIHPKNMDTTIYGTYVKVWKKQQDGKWKLALETGNDGIEIQ